MKLTTLLGSIATSLAVSFAGAQISPTALTYNGKLTDGTNGVNGWYDFQMAVFAASTGGSPLGNGTQAVSHVPVISGTFTVTSDFGTNIFNGAPRWLELAVRTNGGASFALMSPRYTVGSVPIAQYALTPAGPQGSQGDLGATGAAGPQGLQGIPVTNGAKGLNGINGTNGLNGAT